MLHSCDVDIGVVLLAINVLMTLSLKIWWLTTQVADLFGKLATSGLGAYVRVAEGV